MRSRALLESSTRALCLSEEVFCTKSWVQNPGVLGWKEAWAPGGELQAFTRPIHITCLHPIPPRVPGAVDKLSDLSETKERPCVPLLPFSLTDSFLVLLIVALFLKFMGRMRA